MKNGAGGYINCLESSRILPLLLCQETQGVGASISESIHDSLTNTKFQSLFYSGNVRPAVFKMDPIL